MRRLIPYLILWVGLVLAVGFLPRASHSSDAFVSGPVAVAIGSDSATIRWETVERSEGQVDYGVTPALEHNVLHAEPSRRHEVKLTGLLPRTRYYFRVRSGAANSAVAWFVTAEPTPAFHVEPYLQLPKPDSIVVVWEDNQSTPGAVEFGRTPELGRRANELVPPQRSTETGPHWIHQVSVPLHEPPRSEVFYRVRSGELRSPVRSFRVAPAKGTDKWTMAVYGDSRSNPRVHRRIAEAISRAEVDLIVHTGDIVGSGTRYPSWRREFFDPLKPILGRIPWISALGNHERDARHYFDYMALPGNERYYTFDFANAHFICLDSNGWIDKGPGSKQYAWLQEELKKPRQTTWTFVIFHHPLFSAHATRSINRLRWDWGELLLDPAHKVDAVLTGHDHFYARTFPIGRVTDQPTQGVVFLTTAGGGASLYGTKKRDYIAAVHRVHHFTRFEFDGNRATVSAVTGDGKILDQWTMEKAPTPPEGLCAYEIELLKKALREALVEAEPAEIDLTQGTRINQTVELPNPFTVPIRGTFRYQVPPGWWFQGTETPFEVEPSEPFRIPLRAIVDPAGVASTPQLTIEFEPGRFRNRTVVCYPFKIAGPREVRVGRGKKGVIDGIANEAFWRDCPVYPLLATTPAPEPVEPAQVRLALADGSLLVAAQIRDPDHRVAVASPTEKRSRSRVAMIDNHVRVEIHDGQKGRTYAISAQQFPYTATDGKAGELPFEAKAASTESGWAVEMRIPLDKIDPSRLRINVVWHDRTRKRDFELRPGFRIASTPDLIPDWRTSRSPKKLAVVRIQ